MDPRNYEFLSRIEDVIQVYWNEWNCRFSLITKNNKTEMILLLFEIKATMVVSGDEFGILNIWKNSESVKENVENSFNGHGSHIIKTDILGNDSKIITMGLSDRTVWQWIIEFLYDENFRGLEKPTEKDKAQIIKFTSMI